MLNFSIYFHQGLKPPNFQTSGTICVILPNFSTKDQSCHKRLVQGQNLFFSKFFISQGPFLTIFKVQGLNLTFCETLHQRTNYVTFLFKRTFGDFFKFLEQPGTIFDNFWKMRDWNCQFCKLGEIFICFWYFCIWNM